MSDFSQEILQPWMLGGGPESDVILASRIRLARNLAGVPFPNRNEAGELQKVMQTVCATKQSLEREGQQYRIIAMEGLSPLERSILVEKHLISPHLVENFSNRAALIRSDASVSIMVNEEDHLRIQCMEPGLDLTKALANADQVDNVLEETLTFAFSEQLGYLTACPTNVGTGMRASCMLHLPALVLTQQINRIMGAVTQLGLAVRGIYGEGTETIGNIFQVSNQLTLGYTEEEIVDRLSGVVLQLVGQERTARQMLFKQSEEALADRLWRAYGILRYARTITAKEALAKLSEVRLGVDMGIINGVDPSIFNELLVFTRPNYMSRKCQEQGVPAEARGQLRAAFIRNRLAQNEGGNR
ncbi:MAG: protein arginine kinase [Sporomusaceae bacterium]|nr:protein arginine kinase [Sporomusaceae bacterium]